MSDYEKASAEKPGNCPSAGRRQRRIALSAALPGQVVQGVPTLATCNHGLLVRLALDHSLQPGLMSVNLVQAARCSRLRTSSAFRRTEFESRDIRR
jgi:hypothetical protein